ncbi:Rnf-Nqr domain containing protein [Spirochaeta dissipatitropha]
MNESVKVFLDSMLIENPVFMGLFGALAALVLPRTARTSYAPALRFGIALFFSALAASAVSAIAAQWIQPIVHLAVSIVIIAALLKSGDLSGEWLGMPKAVLAAAPIFGIQLLIAQHSNPATVTAAAAGSAAGFAGAYILLGAIRESVMIAESRKIFKTNPVMLFSMAMFALVMSGFLFW